MAQSLPWSVKGIDADTREAAREAARRAGMSVGDWLEHLIRDQARGMQSSDGGHADFRQQGDDPSLLNARLQKLAQSGSQTAMQRGTGRGSSRMQPSAAGQADLAALLAHASQLEARTRDSEARTSTALESIVGWIEKAESRMAAAERAAAERQERATNVIADAIKTVNSRVTHVERRTLDQPAGAPAQPSPQPASPRRPVWSRDGFRGAIGDIQARQRELDQPEEAHRSGTIMRNLRDDLGRLSDLSHGERRQGERRADVTPLMNGLRADLAQLRSEIAGLSAAPETARLEQSIRDLAQRLDERNGAMPLDELTRPIARIESELARLQAANPGERFSRIEHEMQQLGQRIEMLASSASTEPRVLAAAVHELSSLRDVLAHNAATPRLEQLSDQIKTLSQDMSRVREHLAESQPASEVERAIAEMQAALVRETRDANGIGHGLLQRIMHQLDTVSSAMSTLPQGGMGDADRQQLSLLSGKLDQLAQRTRPESDDLAALIESLAIKLDDMAGRQPHELIARVERLSQQIDQLSTRGPAAIERQIDMLAARIETLANSAAPASAALAADLTPIEDMITALARKLDDVARPEAGSSSLHALERQIEALTARLDVRPAASAASVGLENTLQDLMRSLGGLREETTSAVDRAARAAVADAMSTVPKVTAGNEELSLIRRDLAGLRDVHVSIDHRTHSAIGAVNDTLEKIVQRLAQLEEDVTRERVAETAAEVRETRAEPAAPREDAATRRRRAEALSKELAVASVPADASPNAAHEPAVNRTAPPAAVQRAVRAPVLSAEPAIERAADLPLEPGTGRPRPRGEVGGAGTSLNPNLIAAARRAAQAASAAVESNGAEAQKQPKDKSSRFALPISLKETLEKRRKPILLGLAAIVLAIGAGQIATTMLSDPEPPVPAQQPRNQIIQGQATPGGQPAQTEAAAPAKTESATPAKDQTSALTPAAGGQQVAMTQPPADTTGSVRAAPVEVAALPPPDASAPTSAPLSASPERVTNIGALTPAMGTPGLRRAALAGDTNAVYELASRASDGIGMARDQKLALRLFERAAAAGSAPAQFRLANMHEKGIGTGRDAKMAMAWYKRAADKGNAKAIHNLAVLIAEGADGRPDYATAATLFRQAAEFGVRDSQYNLAILLGRGLGVEQDLTQSYTWFAVAARQGDSDAGKKRDEVGAKLNAVDLAAGRTASLNWKPKTPDPVANEISEPAEGWDPQPKPQKPAPRPRAT
jgi:localization factor PodJL